MDVPSVEPAVTVAEPPAPPADPAPADRVRELERELDATRKALQTAQRRTDIHRALAGTGAIDTEAVALVVETTLAAEADGAAIVRAVESIRRSRPALFRIAAPPLAGTRTGAMNARVERPATTLTDVAKDAARSGDRGLLLKYLRLRRGV